MFKQPPQVAIDSKSPPGTVRSKALLNYPPGLLNDGPAVQGNLNFTREQCGKDEGGKLGAPGAMNRTDHPGGGGGLPKWAGVGVEPKRAAWIPTHGGVKPSRPGAGDGALWMPDTAICVDSNNPPRHLVTLGGWRVRRKKRREWTPHAVCNVGSCAGALEAT
eukprot:11676549-Alexandrium_andersonii.AAC.1